MINFINKKHKILLVLKLGKYKVRFTEIYNIINIHMQVNF